MFVEIKNSEFWKELNYIGLILYSVLISLFLATVNFGMSPDQENFYKISEVIHLDNYLAYGAVYWLFLNIFHNILFLKVLTFFSLFFMIVCLNEDKREESKLKALLILTFPIIWWNNKHIDPEIYSSLLGLTGIHLFKKKETLSNLSIVLLILSVSIKISNIVFVFYITVYMILLGYKELKKLIINITNFAFKATILFCFFNPTLVFQANSFFKNLFKFAGEGIKIENLRELYDSHNNYIHWDRPLNLDFFSNSLSVFSFLLLFGILAKNYQNQSKSTIKMYVALFLTFILQNYLILTADRYLGWYMLPIIFLLGYVIKRTNLTKIQIISLIAINLTINFPFLYYNGIFAFERNDVKIEVLLKNIENLEMFKNKKVIVQKDTFYAPHEYGEYNYFNNLKYLKTNYDYLIIDKKIILSKNLVFPRRKNQIDFFKNFTNEHRNLKFVRNFGDIYVFKINNN